MNQSTEPIVVAEPEDPLQPEDPLPVVDSLKEYCATCPLLLPCVDLRIAANIKRARDAETRIFPTIDVRAQEDEASLVGFMRSLPAEQREFVDEGKGVAACLQKSTRLAVDRAMQKANDRKTATVNRPAPAFPETDLATILREAPPETMTQRTLRTLSMMWRGVKDPLGRRQ